MLNKCTAEERITADDALRLLESTDLLSLGEAADRLRQRLHPEGVVTFVVDRNVNYTNVCTTGCDFCAFYRTVDSSEGYLLTHGEIFSKIQELVDNGGTQLLMQGGLNPNIRLDWFAGLFAAIKQQFPTVTIHSLSPPEICYLARLEKMSVIEIVARLKAAGLDSLPGGGAEILDDEVREKVSPGKIKSSEWIGVMEAAHDLNMPTTATMMFGAGEGNISRVKHLQLIRDIQDRALAKGAVGFRAFIPWSFQPGNTALGGETASGLEYLKMLAVSRLFLDNIPNIQASWVTQGLKNAQIALRFGANDLGGTMLEENVVRAAGVTYRTNREELVRIAEDAGFRAAQRNTAYQVL
ncbi:MAG: dehypoxanthine futalosine cyclase [Nitrospirota bacterium]|nr:dehypoxanthine futalosine cyclase [Nitrospirota bacterium]